MNSVRDFARFKTDGRKISMVTAYDAWSAGIILVLTMNAWKLVEKP